VQTAVVSRRRVPGLPLGALVWVVAGVSLAGFAAAWVLAGHNHDVFHVTADTGPDRFLVAYPVVGAVLASRRRSNPIGWFLFGMGVIAAARGLAGEYALDVLAGPGRPQTGVWAGFCCLLVAAASVVVRYRRSAGEERLQLKWFAYAVTVNLVLLAVTTPLGANDRAAQVAYSLAVVAGVGLALPVAIGVAVLKYRLYAIDKIISRTVSYAVVTGLVVGSTWGAWRCSPTFWRSAAPWGWRSRCWWRRRCSTRCGGGSRRWSTGGSTGPGTTPSG
jgi:hypothetical protein